MAGLFKKLKGVNEDIRHTIFYDLGCLELKKTNGNKYHYSAIKNNLIDLLGYPKQE